MRGLLLRWTGVAWTAGMMLVLAGCANNPRNPDPFEKPNRFFYDVNDLLDRALLKPASDLYVKVLPTPVRTGIGNALDNLHYANVILNDFLQGKNAQGASDSGRMAVNSTIGVLGIFDVATKWGMPRHRNDFGITLGKWGSGPGPYLVLPLLGPTSGRDAPGIVVSIVTNPVYWLDQPWTVTVPLDVTSALDERTSIDAAIRFRNRAALDPYLFTREAYLRHRLSRIHEGQSPTTEGFYESSTAPATQPASAPGRR